VTYFRSEDSKNLSMHFMYILQYNEVISFAKSQIEKIAKKQFKLILMNSACVMMLDECLMPFAYSSWSQRGSSYRASNSSWFDDTTKRMCFAPIDAAHLGWFVSEWYEHRKIRYITFVCPYMCIIFLEFSNKFQKFC